MGRPGLLGLAARTAVVAGTAHAVSNGMQARQAQAADAAAYREQAQPLAAAAPMQAPIQAPAPPVQDVVTQLERLAALHSQGILTDDEFAVQKSRILGG